MPRWKNWQGKGNGVSMDYAVIKKMIEEEIIDFDKLLLQNYKRIGLSEIEAFLLIELHRQRKAGETVISPSKLVKKLTIPEEKLFTVLDGLITKKYLTISLIKQENERETEDFSLDNTIVKLIDVYKSDIKHEIINGDKEYMTSEAEVVDIIENQFQKQLKPLEIELIQKWLNEDDYPLEMIKKAILEAVKANKSTLSYVDGVLLKYSKNIEKSKKTYKTDNSEALKAFYDTWEKK